jgi:type II secretory pathway pseudopilin PulG
MARKSDANRSKSLGCISLIIVLTAISYFVWPVQCLFLSFNSLPIFRHSFCSLLIRCGGCCAYGPGPKENIGAINRAQQAYFLEYQEFTTDLAQLGVGIKNPSGNYSYSIRATKNAVFNFAVSLPGTYRYRTEYFGPFWWEFKEPLKSYVGAVFAVPTTNLDPKANNGELETVAITCEALRPGATQPAAPTLQEGIPTCGEGTRDLAKPQTTRNYQ